MTTGYSQYSTVSSLINSVYEASFFTLMEYGVMPRLVTQFSMQGMQPRIVTKYNNGNVRQIAEGDAVAPTKFDKTSLSTLTPYEWADNYLLTDVRIDTDSDNVRADAASNLGMSFGEVVDTQIAANFSSLTGGTVGAAMGTVTMSQVFSARSRLKQAKVPGPYVCVLGAGQWYHLIAQNGTAVSSTFTRATGFQDALIDNYFSIPSMADVVFAVCANISGAGGGTAYGALYSPQAIAFDVRKAFTIEPQRNANRRAWELNASMAFATGTWRPLTGVQLISTDVIPTTGI